MSFERHPFDLNIGFGPIYVHNDARTCRTLATHATDSCPATQAMKSDSVSVSFERRAFDKTEMTNNSVLAMALNSHSSKCVQAVVDIITKKKVSGCAPGVRAALFLDSCK